MALAGPPTATQAAVLVVVKVALEGFAPNKPVEVEVLPLLVLELQVLLAQGRAEAEA